MQTVIEYRILYMRTTDAFDITNDTPMGEFVNRINEKIDEGWQPLGAPWLMNNDKQINQTMVKYDQSIFDFTSLEVEEVPIGIKE